MRIIIIFRNQESYLFMTYVKQYLTKLSGRGLLESKMIIPISLKMNLDVVTILFCCEGFKMHKSITHIFL